MDGNSGENKIAAENISLDAHTDKAPAAHRFNEIYDNTYDEIYAYVLKKCSCIADVSDIMQEIYFELHRVLTKKGIGYIKIPRIFVYKLAKRKLAKYYRLSAKIKNAFAYSLNDDEAENVTDISDEFMLEDFVVNAHTLEHAERLIGKKDETTKKCMYLFYKENRAISEIAQILSITESNVKNKIYRTLKKLRSELK